jgi:hypothetical protein
VQPQLGLLKSTMLQLDPAFNERAYGGSSFSDFVEKLKRAELVNVSGTGGRYIIERKTSSAAERPTLKPDDLLPALRDVLENHRLELENGCPVDDLAGWFKAEQPNFDHTAYGFQEFIEFLNYAQDKTVVRLEPHEEQGMLVSLGAEFYPPAEPPQPEPQAAPQEEEVEEYEPQGGGTFYAAGDDTGTLRINVMDFERPADGVAPGQSAYDFLAGMQSVRDVERLPSGNAIARSARPRADSRA